MDFSIIYWAVYNMYLKQQDQFLLHGVLYQKYKLSQTVQPGGG